MKNQSSPPSANELWLHGWIPRLLAAPGIVALASILLAASTSFAQSSLPVGSAKQTVVQSAHSPTGFPGAVDPGATLLPYPSVFVHAGDPAIQYSEFLNATIDASGATFDRLDIPWFSALHSPGTRISFRSDATQIKLVVSYSSTYQNPGAGIFRVEVDGVLDPRRLGSDTATGLQEYDLIERPSPGDRVYCLIVPYGSDVTFVGLRLVGGSGALLGSPPPRPPFLYAAYGDSITQGLDGSSSANSYPFLLGALRGWSVLNMGFRARTVTPSDGTVLGNIGADCLTVAIGLNDYFQATLTPLEVYEDLYSSFLTNIRLVQPTVPIFAITPTWVDFETTPNSIGLLVEDYRAVIRTVVARKALIDSNLYLIEGSSLVTGNLTNFPDGIHPNDAGFVEYANSLSSEISAVLGAPGGEAVALEIAYSESERAESRSGHAAAQFPDPAVDDRERRSIQSALNPIDDGRASYSVLAGGSRGAGARPTLRLSGLPVIGSTTELLLTSGSVEPVLATLAVSTMSDTPLGALEVFGSLIGDSSVFVIPDAGMSVPLFIPSELAPGLTVRMQLVEFDPFGQGTLASSRPISLTLGT